MDIQTSIAPNNQQQMIVDSNNYPSNHQQLVQDNIRVIKPIGPPIIYPLTDGIQSSDLLTDLENPILTSTWATSSMDDKL